jgi:hypothetical protein
LLKYRDALRDAIILALDKQITYANVLNMFGFLQNAPLENKNAITIAETFTMFFRFSNSSDDEAIFKTFIVSDFKKETNIACRNTSIAS